jgi:hypothetical protein
MRPAVPARRVKPSLVVRTQPLIYDLRRQYVGEDATLSCVADESAETELDVPDRERSYSAT